jgi:hypothetical protein
VLGEGARRAARAAVRPLTPPGAGAGSGPPRPRKRRARAVWWVIGVAACLVAIAAAILVLQNQGAGLSPDAAKSPGPDGRATPSTSPPTPLPTPGARVPAALAGTWSGQVSQTGPAADVFKAEVTLTPGASPGTVHYSGGSGASFACTGDLVPVSDSAGTLKLDQVIAHGPCAGGMVTLSPAAGDTVQFSFKGKQGPMATGTLTKS